MSFETKPQTVHSFEVVNNDHLTDVPSSEPDAQHNSDRSGPTSLEQVRTNSVNDALAGVVKEFELPRPDYEQGIDSSGANVLELRQRVAGQPVGQTNLKAAA